MDAYVITGPTSGIGKATALALADRQRTIILVGRNNDKLKQVQSEIGKDKPSKIVLCDFSDVVQCRKAAQEVLDVCKKSKLRLRTIVNNAGAAMTAPVKSAQGWDMTFAVCTMAPLAFTEVLLPSLADQTQVLFLVSKVEDPDQPLPKKAGLRGGRFISVEASTKSEWDASDRNGGPSKRPGADAYATSKQCVLAYALALARENPQLRINAIEPGWIPSTGLFKDASTVERIMGGYVLPMITPFIDGASTTHKAGAMIARLATIKEPRTGAYFNEKGAEMQASTLVRNEKHQDHVLNQSRVLLAGV